MSTFMYCYLKKWGYSNYIKQYVNVTSMVSIRNISKSQVVELEDEKNTWETSWLLRY